ncbi:MAG: hypothetical protein V4721_16425 [Bacteroidota bacterium]
MDKPITEMSGLKFFFILVVSLLITTGAIKLIGYGMEHIKITSGT